jgi:hypothetical protein
MVAQNAKARKSTNLWLASVKLALAMLWTSQTNVQLFQLFVGDG